MGDSIGITLTAKMRHSDLLSAARRLGTQKILAEKLGVDQHTLSGWINLKAYPRRTAKIESALLAELYFEYDEVWPPELRREIDRRRGLKQKNWATVEVTKMVTVEALAQLESRGAIQLEAPKDWQQISEMRDDIEESLRKLDTREREIIEARFGLNTGVELSREEIGESFGICGQRVSQIEARAIAKLQRRAPALFQYAEP